MSQNGNQADPSPEPSSASEAARAVAVSLHANPHEVTVEDLADLWLFMADAQETVEALVEFNNQLMPLLLSLTPEDEA